MLQLVLYITILLRLFAFPTAGIAEQSRADKNSPSAKTIRVAFSVDSAPYHFIDSAGRPAGMAVDIWRLWSQRTGIPLTFVPGTWGETLNMVKNGQADAHAGLLFSEERARYFDYVSPLFPTTTWLYYAKDFSISQDLKNIVGFPVGMVTADLAENAFQKAYPKAKIIFYPDNTHLFQAVQSGEIQAFVKESPIARFFLSQYGLAADFVHTDTPLYENTFYSAVRLGDDAAAQIVTQGFHTITTAEKELIQRRWTGISGSGKSTITIAVPNNNAPLTFVDAQGNATGLYVDIWKTALREIGLKPTFVPLLWKDSIEAVVSGRADMHSGILKTLDPKMPLLYSNPFHELAIGIYTRTTPLLPAGFHDLKGKRIGVVDDTVNLKNIKQRYPNHFFVSYAQATTMLRDLAAQKLDAALADTTSTPRLLLTLGLEGTIMPQGPPLYRTTVHAVVSDKSEGLMHLINNGLSALSRDQLMSLEQQWLENPSDRFYKPFSNEIHLSEDEREWLNAHPLLRIVVDPSFPPIDFKNEKNEHEGISADYLKIFAEKLGVSFEIIPSQTWAESEELLMAGKADFSPALMETPERKEELFFTDPYIRIPTVIITRASQDKLTDIEHLSGRNVAVVKGYASTNHFMNRRPEIHFVLVASPSQGLQMTATGQTDAIILNLATASWIIDHDALTGLKISGKTDFELALAMGSRRDIPLLNAILQRSLNSVGPKQQQAIFKKWVRLELPLWTPSQELLLIGSAACLLFFVFGLWNRRLSQAIRVRDAAKEALRQSEERFALALLASADGLWDWDIKTNTVYFSPSYKKMIGFNENDTLDLNTGFLDRLHPLDKDGVIRRIESLLEFHGPAWILEFRLQNRAGLFLWMEQRGQVVSRSPAGEPLRAIGTLSDISARKQTDAMRDSLIKTLHNFPLPVALTDTQGHIEYANSMFTTITEYEHKELQGCSLNILTPGQKFPFRFSTMDTTQAIGNVWHGQVILQRKNGERYETTLILQGLTDEKGTLSHYILVESTPYEGEKHSPQMPHTLIPMPSIQPLDIQQQEQIASFAHELDASLSMARYNAMDLSTQFAAHIQGGGYDDMVYQLSQQIHGFAFEEARQTLRTIVMALGIQHALPTIEGNTLPAKHS